ncbi:hypothetical protein [Kocuria sp.]|uniref:hypothetical protein n=1 Tax=Kocuria sp. TaxID=1871328 RepID=UPI0026DFF6DE|nr:hypothetical protein [Kocuria sp.]MDO5617268.1 hypothetical protein [Kocuria sp.]
MPQITLRVPDLVECTHRVHPDLGSVVEEFCDADQNNLAEAASLCQKWIAPEFMKLLNELELDGRLPDIDFDIDATDASKRVLTFRAHEGTTTEDVRGLVQRAWKATLNTYADALYYRAQELATGHSTPDWTPDKAVGSPTL